MHSLEIANRSSKQEGHAKTKKVTFNARFDCASESAANASRASAPHRESEDVKTFHNKRSQPARSYSLNAVHRQQNAQTPASGRVLPSNSCVRSPASSTRGRKAGAKASTRSQMQEVGSYGSDVRAVTF